MKKICLLLALLMLSLSLLAAAFADNYLDSISSLIKRDSPIPSPFGEVRHSAVLPSGNMHFFWEDLSGNYLPYEFYYTTDSQNWTQAAPGDDPSTTAIVPYQYLDRMHYRLKTYIDGIDYVGEMAYMHAAYIDESPIVPTAGQYALICEDEVGDSLMVYKPYYDLTDLSMVCNNEQLYVSLGNVSGTFPTLNSLSSYNLFAVILANESLEERSALAMVYTFSIPGVISPGLYKVTLGDDYTPGFNRLGNISSTVQSGKLHMSCNIADIGSDPDFGTWPSEHNNLLLISALSFNITLDMGTMEPEFKVGDMVNGGVVEFCELAYDEVANSLPVLSAPRLDNGTLSVMYEDANGDFPLVMEYIRDEGPALPLSFQGIVNGKRLFSCPFPEDVIEGHFYCSDNLIDYVTLDFSVVSVLDDIATPAKIDIAVPNPMRGSASHKIKIEAGDNMPIDVALYDLKGRKLGTIYQGRSKGGIAEFEWDARHNGQALKSGIYFLRVNTDKASALKRITLIK